MRLSTKIEYGTRAMIELARHYQGNPLTRKDIEKSQRISCAYLENILIALRSHRLVRSVRGTNGGFKLESSPASITMFEVMGALQGSLAPVKCVEDPNACERSTVCAAHRLWQHLFDMQVALLKKTTLQSLIDAVESEPSSDYCI